MSRPTSEPRSMSPMGEGVLKRGSTRFWVVKGYALPPSAPALQFLDEFSAKTFLRGFLHEPSSMAEMRGCLWRDGMVGDLSMLDDDEVIQEFAERLAAERLRLVVAAPGRSQGGGGVAAEPQAETAGERPTRRPPVFREDRGLQHWVRLKVVDDETGEPIPGVRIRVKLPSGEVGAPTTDRRGIIHIGDLTPGTLDIQEILDDDALEVVGIE